MNERLGQGREAEILDWGNGRVLRLLWRAERAPSLDREEAALRAASAAGAPVPAPFERVSRDGRPGLVMERAWGPDLLTRLGARPWTVLAVGRTLGVLQAQLHRVRAPDTLPELKGLVREAVAARRDLVPDHLAARADGLLHELPGGDRLCHGDFHPANVLLTAQGPRVIDWSSASRGDPMADVARTLLLIRLAEIPEHAPTLVRRLDRLGRRLMLASYLRAYGHLDRQLIEHWQRLLLIGRLAEDIPGERAKLLALLERS